VTRKKRNNSTVPPLESERPTLQNVEAANAIEPEGEAAANGIEPSGEAPVEPTESSERAADAAGDDDGVATPRGDSDDAGAQADSTDAGAQADSTDAGAQGASSDAGTQAESTDAGATSEDGEVEAARELTQIHLRGLLEALVFASDKPMKTGELARLASAPARQVKDVMGELRAEYLARGIVLDEVAGGWLFRTNAQYAPFVRELTGGRPVRLSRAQLETLAIAAYRQPITRPEIDEIRGVDSGATLKLLLERDLVRILGKKDEPGRPLLYGTTTHFLEFFNMKSLKDLPTLREFTELSDESLRVAEAELGDVLPEAATVPPAPRPAEPERAPEHDPEAAPAPEREPEDDDSQRETIGPPPVDE
jgi:segregation and condensation protein B